MSKNTNENDNNSIPEDLFTLLPHQKELDQASISFIDNNYIPAISSTNKVFNKRTQFLRNGYIGETSILTNAWIDNNHTKDNIDNDDKENKNVDKEHVQTTSSHELFSLAEPKLPTIIKDVDFIDNTTKLLLTNDDDKQLNDDYKDHKNHIKDDNDDNKYTNINRNYEKDYNKE